MPLTGTDDPQAQAGADSKPAVPAPRRINPKMGALMDLTVLSVSNLTPRMKRIILTGEALATFEYRPGQELVLIMPAGQDEKVRRFYSIRRLNRTARTLELNVLVHGDAPGARWAAAVQPGDAVQAAGPHGRIAADPTADWHIFFSDEAGLPPMCAILESLPPTARATVFAEVAGPRDKLQNEAVAEVEVNWRFRGPMPAHESRLLPEAAAEYPLPAGRCHAYVMGETSVVREVRKTLRARGLEVAQVSSEGLWRPGRVGGHDHVTEAAQTP